MLVLTNEQTKSPFRAKKKKSHQAIANHGCSLFSLVLPHILLSIMVASSTSILAESFEFGQIKSNSTLQQQPSNKPRAKQLDVPFIKETYVEPVIHAYRSDFVPTYAEQSKLSISDVIRIEVIAKVYTFLSADVLFQRYENPEDLKQSGGPEADQELCLKQLNQLLDRASMLRGEKGKSRDIEMFRLLDNFGRVPPGVFGGELTWLGSYRGCLRSTISLEGDRVALRYCSSSFKLNDWPEDKDLDDYAVLKLGVCLPKSCDSVDYKNKFQLIQQLAEFNSRQVDFETWNFTYLYCLPDEQSNLRIWWKSPSTVAAVCVFTGWFLLLIFASFKHRQSFANKKGNNNNNRVVKAHFGLTSGLKLSSSSAADKTLINDRAPSTDSDKMGKIYRALSIYHNFRLLCKTERKSSNSSVVDLRPLDGIKTICTIYVVVGHETLLSLLIKRNWRDFFTTSDALSYVFPAVLYAVNTFFTLTGMMKAYNILKKSPEEIALMIKPTRWLEFVKKRYLKLMPLYIILVAYEKYLAVYTGSGPMWDYATSFESPRRCCQNQSWLWTLLFSTNIAGQSTFSCVPPSWYIDNDLQFALITPPLMACFGKSEKLCKWLIGLLISASISISIVQRYISPALDYRPSTEMSYSFLKINSATENRYYMGPQYRVTSYLIGLLLGISLHHYEQNKLKWLEAQSDSQNSINNNNPNQQTGSGKPRAVAESKEFEPSWPAIIRRYYPMFFLVTFAALFLFSPHAGHESSKQEALIFAIIAIPLGNIYASFSMGLFILLSITGYGVKGFNKIVSHKNWKPFGRLGLAALLINFEVIIFFTSRLDYMEHYDKSFTLLMAAFVLVTTYLAAAVLFVLIDSPLKELLAVYSDRKPRRQGGRGISSQVPSTVTQSTEIVTTTTVAAS